MKTLEKKTAVLLAACTQIGAITAGADYDLQVRCRQFGHLLGCSFQIKDDIFDYYDDANIGKPTGNDIREGKITLPLLYALKNAPEKERSYYYNIIDKQDFTKQNVNSLIHFSKQGHGIEYAEKRLSEFKQKAVEIIHSFPESDARNSLLLLADYFSERAK
jgi:octaprenyl-diphosphate synthase